MAAILTVFGAVVFFRASSQIVAGDGFFSTPFLPEFVFFGIGMAATIAAILLIVKSPVSLIIRDEDKKTNSSVKHWRFPNIKHWRFPVRNWVLPILLLPIAAQSAFLLWLHRTEIVQLFFRPQISRCLAPAADTQLCSAMKDVSNVPAGQFFYGGAMGTAALRSPPLLDKLQLAHPSFHLHYLDPLVVAPDSTTGIQMLIRGELSFAESQRPLRDAEYRQARLRGFHLRQIPVATTGVAFFTHPDLSLPGLSLDQVQAIYTGQLTNWQQVGGPNLPIVPISQDTNREGCTMRLLLQGLPPAEQHLSRQVARVQDTTASLRQVAATPGAIGFGTQALVVNQQSVRLIGLAKWRSRQYVPPATPDGQVNQAALRNGTYPLMQRLFVVVREDGTLDELAGIAYANLLLSEEGQLSSQRAGYLPVRSTVIESRQIARARSISVLAGARRWPLAGSLEPLLLFPEP
jgi:phosphate transport system substrate-binding protein